MSRSTNKAYNEWCIRQRQRNCLLVGDEMTSKIKQGLLDELGIVIRDNAHRAFSFYSMQYMLGAPPARLTGLEPPSDIETWLPLPPEDMNLWKFKREACTMHAWVKNPELYGFYFDPQHDERYKKKREYCYRYLTTLRLEYLEDEVSGRNADKKRALFHLLCCVCDYPESFTV